MDVNLNGFTLQQILNLYFLDLRRLQGTIPFADRWGGQQFDIVRQKLVGHIALLQFVHLGR